MEIGRYAACLALLAIPCAPSANAATFVATYTGTIESGLDTSGIFGPARTDLAGQAFAAVFTLTVPTPGALLSTGTSPNGRFSNYYGGSLLGHPSPAFGALTIGSVTASFAGDRYGGVQILDEYFGTNGLDQVRHDLQDDRSASGVTVASGLFATLFSGDNNIVDSSSFTVPLSHVAGPGDFGQGEFTILETDTASGAVLREAAGRLIVSSLSIAQFGTVPGAPEPATWALLLVGFGVCGVALRRHRVTIRGVGAALP